MEAPDIRLLASEELTDAAFPGGRNEAFRVYFSPEVHGSLWKHASEDTSVEICGVLVGTWHRDEIGPFARVVESIRGEAAQNKFAEVTFTHQTWAKINAEMDSKYAAMRIVGWYHTHPDFGIFLSDRDRFIQEHFFSGPGQIAHVIDPIRRLEGVFIWRDGKPTPADHFWVGDRILMGPDSSRPEAGGHPQSTGAPPRPVDGPNPSTLRLILSLSVFLVGYLLATIQGSWERMRATEAEVARNNVAAVLRIGLADELERLRRDLAPLASALEAVRSKPEAADRVVEEIRRRLSEVDQRAEALKAHFGNAPEVDAYLRRYLLERDQRVPSTSRPVESKPGSESRAEAPASPGKS